MRRFYCYVDESGQDTRGELFIVVVVLAAEARDELRELCEKVERETGKGTVKWVKAEHRRRIAYLEKLLTHPWLRGKVSIAVYRDTHSYAELTTQTIALTLESIEVTDYKATVLIDGLPRSLEHSIGKQLRQLGLPVKKVRGAQEGQPTLTALYQRAVREGVVRDLFGK